MEILDSTGKQKKKKKKNTRIEKKEIKWLFCTDRIVQIENPQESSNKCLELIKVKHSWI